MKPVIIACLFILFTTANNGVSAHPIKLTVGKLQYSPASGTFQLTVNFFVDDFEAALRKHYSIPALNISKNKLQALKTIQDYTSSRLNIRVNSKTWKFTATDLNLIEKNVLQVKYVLTIPPQQKIEEIEISNQLLFEIYDEQVNILHVLSPHKEEKMLRFMPFQYRKKITL